MHRGAADQIACGLDGVVHAPAVQAMAAVRRQQGRMDVQDAAHKPLQRLRSQLAHISGQHDQLGARGLHGVGDGDVGGLGAALGRGADMAAGQAHGPREGQRRAFTIVADHQARLGLKLARADRRHDGAHTRASVR